MQLQKEFIEQNEKAHRNIPDPVCSVDEGQGEVARNAVFKNVRECISH